MRNSNLNQNFSKFLFMNFLLSLLLISFNADAQRYPHQGGGERIVADNLNIYSQGYDMVKVGKILKQHSYAPLQNAIIKKVVVVVQPMAPKMRGHHRGQRGHRGKRGHRSMASSVSLIVDGQVLQTQNIRPSYMASKIVFDLEYLMRRQKVGARGIKLELNGRMVVKKIAAKVRQARQGKRGRGHRGGRF